MAPAVSGLTQTHLFLQVEKLLENGHGMFLLLNQDLESVELDVVRKYQYFMRRVGNQAARSMFMEEYLALQDLNIPQEHRDRFVMAGHKLFLNLKLPTLDPCEKPCVGAVPMSTDA